MVAWIQGVMQGHPEIAFFLVLGLGYLFGKLALGSFKLGAVTGTLLAGVLVGQLGITIPNEVKQCFFLLFLFAIGFIFVVINLVVDMLYYLVDPRLRIDRAAAGGH